MHEGPPHGAEAADQSSFRRRRRTHAPRALAARTQPAQPLSVSSGLRLLCAAQNDARGAAVDEERQQQLREQERGEVVGRQRLVHAIRKFRRLVALRPVVDWAVHNAVQFLAALLEGGDERTHGIEVVRLHGGTLDNSNVRIRRLGLAAQLRCGTLSLLLCRAREHDHGASPVEVPRHLQPRLR